MSSILIQRFRICQRPLKPFFLQGSLSFFTLETSLGKSLQLPLSACFLCTRSKTGSSQTDGGRGGVRKPFRDNESWAEGRGKSNFLRQMPSFPKSMFAAGTAKRTAEMERSRKGALASRDEKRTRGTTRGAGSMQPPDRPLSVDEWGKLKESLGNVQRFAVNMMRHLLKSGAELDVAKSLLTFVVMETGTLSYELLVPYLVLCVRTGQDAEVFDVYDIMRGTFPSLDTGAFSLFIHSFSRTSRWREAVGILHDLKKVFSPSSRNYGDVISAAMSHGHTATAWALYDEMIENGLSPLQETWEALFKGARKIEEETGKEAEFVSQSEHEEKLLEILLYMRNNQIYPNQSLASTIKFWFESLTEQKWTGTWTCANSKGLCGCCGSELESIQLTTEEYKQLKDRVMTDIIQGQDVFNKTTPEELERFKRFVKERPAFDVVIDGLNVANIRKHKRKPAEMLLTVVSGLHRRGLTILVLGRQHMLQPSKLWNKYNMAPIMQKAHCFFTENISEDDPFLLYATLHSGNHCQFISRDLMRDHKACLSDRATRRLFFKWQRGHQLAVTGYNGSVQYLSIPKYDTIIQSSADSWHLPYDDTDDRSSYEIPQRWLCLTRKH